MLAEVRARARAGGAALIVAHRRTAVIGADRVVVLHDGRVAEEGTPEQLAVGGGWFESNFFPEKPPPAPAAPPLGG